MICLSGIDRKYVWYSKVNDFFVLYLGVFLFDILGTSKISS